MRTFREYLMEIIALENGEMGRVARDMILNLKFENLSEFMGYDRSPEVRKYYDQAYRKGDFIKDSFFVNLLQARYILDEYLDHSRLRKSGCGWYYIDQDATDHSSALIQYKGWTLLTNPFMEIPTSFAEIEKQLEYGDELEDYEYWLDDMIGLATFLHYRDKEPYLSYCSCFEENDRRGILYELKDGVCIVNPYSISFPDEKK